MAWSGHGRAADANVGPRQRFERFFPEAGGLDGLPAVAGGLSLSDQVALDDRGYFLTGAEA